MDLGNLTQIRDTRLNRSHGVPPCECWKQTWTTNQIFITRFQRTRKCYLKHDVPRFSQEKKKKKRGGSVIVSQLFLQPLSSSSVHLLATDKSSILFVTSRPSLTTSREDSKRGVSLSCFHKNEKDLCFSLRLFNQFKLNTIHLTTIGRVAAEFHSKIYPHWPGVHCE